MAIIRFMKQNKLIFLFQNHRNENYYIPRTLFHKESVCESNLQVASLSNGKTITFSTGKYARLADGCAITNMGDTSVMVTTVSKFQPSSTTSFFPLIVDYKQKGAAAGRIPTNFFRRELGYNEHEILTSRIIDRSLRPLFPENYKCETQVVCNILALDGIHDSDILAINGASAALAVSDIPWNGPIGAVRIGCIDNEVLINPTRHEMEKSTLNLIVTAASKNLVIMLDGYADNILMQDLRKALKIGVKECQIIINAIQNLQNKNGKKKRDIEPSVEFPKEIVEVIKSLYEIKLREIFTDYKHDKQSRDCAISNLRNTAVTTIKSAYNTDASVILEIFNEFSKSIFRSLIFENNCRCDGRKFDELRDIKCEVDLFKPLHGSALFQRGQTQVLCTITLDSPDSTMKMDPITMLTSGIKDKNFFLHYEFPPYATNETGRTGLKGRREMGHGVLAERGLRAVVPKDYPFTIRLTSEVLESNGSSSMASVCGGSLALLDAGVPISAPVAGVAIGLIANYEENTKTLTDYKLLTDILGIEDYLGDMDFKVAGTKKGFTSLQADIKISGIPLKIVMESLVQAHDAKNQILNIMHNTIAKPRSKEKDNMPVIEKIEIPTYQHRGKLLGINGNNIKKIFIQTGVHINEEEELKFNLFAPNQIAMNEAKEIINQLITQPNVREPTLEFGGIYTAKIVELKELGVMVTLYPSMQPTLLHNSQLDQRRISHPSALNLEVGQEIQVKYFGRDPISGNMRLSRKVLQTTIAKTQNYNLVSS